MKDVMAEIQDKLTEYISTIIQQESLKKSFHSGRELIDESSNFLTGHFIDCNTKLAALEG